MSTEQTAEQCLAVARETFEYEIRVMDGHATRYFAEDIEIDDSFVAFAPKAMTSEG